MSFEELEEIIKKEQEEIFQMKLERYKEGIIQILEQRGYKVKEIGFKEDFMELVARYAKKRRPPHYPQEIYVRCFYEQSVGIAEIRKLKTFMEENAIEMAMICGMGKFTHHIEKFTKEINREKREEGLKHPYIEYIDNKHPLFDIFMHELIPKHEIVPESEVQKILEKYNIKKSQMPKIRRSDIAAVTLKARPGDVIKITRKSETAGEYVVYRLVVRG